MLLYYRTKLKPTFSQMKCCGVNNGYDWKNSNPDFSAGGSEFKVPVGCCHWQKNADGAWVDLPEAERDVSKPKKVTGTQPFTRSAERQFLLNHGQTSMPLRVASHLS